ncbi:MULTISPECIES: hypothetical protein [unclassified Clostridioides]|uniref:hypothetical protein n=1 Tax=unclassified Clostridioides TaxID=2635829 RepID=UPI001D1279D3|nr:hypothetical protein [Clostridioides sp. ZZV14-6048]MCC0739982.1 hypothetical protein [Clostridioides sp. ZZV14-5902]
MEVKEVLRNNRGSSYILGFIVVLIVLMLFAGLCEFTKLRLLTTNIRNALQTATISVATENWSEVYPSLRESHGAAYKLDSDKWVENTNKGNIEYNLEKILKVERRGSYYAKIGDGEEIYKLSNLRTKIVNRELAPKDVNKAKKYSVETTVDLEIPFSFGFTNIKPFKKEINVIATYSSKF